MKLKSLIHLEHVSFAYEDTPVLWDVSLDIKEGECIGIIGPNGGGKTTLLKLILGFLKPNTGIINIGGAPPSEKKIPTAYVPQALRYDKLFPISVMELVLQGRLSHLPWYGRFSKQDELTALEALERVDLVHLKERSFGTLSGGQAQRALIARALASHPKLLLLDEPTANVDSEAESSIYSLLETLSHEMTLLMVTHDFKAINHFLHRLFCIQGTIAHLKPAEVCDHFSFGLYHPSTTGPS